MQILVRLLHDHEEDGQLNPHSTGGNQNQNPELAHHIRHDNCIKGLIFVSPYHIIPYTSMMLCDVLCRCEPGERKLLNYVHLQDDYDMSVLNRAYTLRNMYILVASYAYTSAINHMYISIV